MSRVAPPEGGKSRPILLYVGVMFAVAMLLLLLSFLMQQRNYEALMDSVDNMQELVELERAVQALETERLALQAELAEAQSALQDETGLRESLGHRTHALLWLLEIRHLYDTGEKDAAKELLRTFSVNAYLRDNLPDFQTKNPDLSSGQEIYEALLAALYPEGLPAEAPSPQ